MRRVVVTGVGMVTPLGADVETVWASLIASKSGAGPITRFDATGYACRIAMEVKRGDGSGDTFDASRRVDHKVQRQVDPFIVYGIDAAGQALEDAGLTDMTEAERFRAGCTIGSGIGGLPGHRGGIDRPPRKGSAPGLAALRPWPADQPDLRSGQHQIRPDGAEPCGRHRLLDRRTRDRRCGADDRARRCRRDAGGR